MEQRSPSQPAEKAHRRGFGGSRPSAGGAGTGRREQLRLRPCRALATGARSSARERAPPELRGCR
eukprot:11949529-Alexandrium_andersonii.AAC.1